MATLENDSPKNPSADEKKSSRRVESERKSFEKFVAETQGAPFLSLRWDHLTLRHVYVNSYTRAAWGAWYGRSLSRTDYVKGFLAGLLSIALFQSGYNSLWPKDSTDPINGRSGLGLHVDAQTGCEYVRDGFIGGMTPRIATDGKTHLGCGNVK